MHLNLCGRSQMTTQRSSLHGSVSESTQVTIGRKLLNGIGALALVGFMIVHLSGNLQLYSTDGTAFNAYAKFLHDLGPLLVRGRNRLAGYLFYCTQSPGIGLWLKNRSREAIGIRPVEQGWSQQSCRYLSNNMFVSGRRC